MISVSLFNQAIDDKLYSYGASGRQSKATKRGTLVEDVAAEILLKHPAVAKIEKQVFVEQVDEFSKIDLLLTLRNNVKVYLPVARDLWLGTSQQDRLQLQVYKFKLGLFDNIEYCYLCSSDYKEFLAEPCTKRARRKPTLQKWANELANVKILHNIETLWDHLIVLNNR